MHGSGRARLEQRLPCSAKLLTSLEMENRNIYTPFGNPLETENINIYIYYSHLNVQ